MPALVRRHPSCSCNGAERRIKFKFSPLVAVAARLSFSWLIFAISAAHCAILPPARAPEEAWRPTRTSFVVGRRLGWPRIGGGRRSLRNSSSNLASRRQLVGKATAKADGRRLELAIGKLLARAGRSAPTIRSSPRCLLRPRPGGASDELADCRRPSAAIFRFLFARTQCAQANKRGQMRACVAPPQRNRNKCTGARALASVACRARPLAWPGRKRLLGASWLSSAASSRRRRRRCYSIVRVCCHKRRRRTLSLSPRQSAIDERQAD